MRTIIRQFVELCVQTLPLLEPIVEFGADQGQESIVDLRPLFPGKEYIGTDRRPGPGVNQIFDLHEIDLPSQSVGTVILLDTLEHIEYPRKALDEVKRILQPDGIVFLSSAMLFPIHRFPNDYWRFTPEALRSLLKPFAVSLVEFAGDPNFPHTVVGVGFQDSPAISVLHELHRRLQEWKNHWTHPALSEREESPCAVAGDIVKFHYACRLPNGRLAESTADDKPRQIRIGSGQLNPVLDHALLGMKPGEARSIRLSADQSYGLHQPEKVFTADRCQFPANIPLHIGQRLQIKKETGEGLPVTVTAIHGSTIQLDSNHPLAGQDLVYDLWLVEIIR